MRKPNYTETVLFLAALGVALVITGLVALLMD
jgi:hypothetical protein